jgi:P4 family phage/plasmid primase-like protien
MDDESTSMDESTSAPVDVSTLTELGKAAVWYAGHGFAVFPLGTRSKRPITTSGLKDWTDDPENAAQCWQMFPTSNIGLVCGMPSHGLLVIDLDVSDEKDGMATLREWEKANGELPETATSITGSGGRHLFYRTDRTGIHPSVNHELGVDIRSDGSYVIPPPSIHPSGELYEWWADPRDVGIAEADGAVYDFIDYVQRNGGQDELKKPNGKFRLPDKIPKGKRDDTLFKFAAHLRAIGRSDEEIFTNVAGANITRCDVPLEQSEVERIVKSACRYDRGGDAETDQREVGKPGRGLPPSSSGGDAESFIGPRGGIDTTALGMYIIDKRMARIIDGAPAVWTGTRWDFGARAIKRATVAVCRKAKIKDKNEVLSFVMDSAPRVSSSNAFDGRYYVQFSNCTYDVLSGECVTPEPSMYIIGTLPIALDIDAPIGLADAFIDSISAGDDAVKTHLCEIIGAAMCSSRIVSQAPMLIGRARGGAGKAANGKSTFINWLAAIVGSENVTSLSIDDFGNRFNKGMVVGKLANLGDDIPDGFLQGDQLSTFKKMVTGDSIYADVKGTDGFEFRPSALQVFSMNTIPRLSDTTDGIMRRLDFTPFRAEFRPGDIAYDPNMEKKLSERGVLERGALLGLIALPDLIERGRFTDIPDMRDELDAVRIDNSSVARWVTDECVEPQWLNGRSVAEAYKAYTDWAEEAGERYVRNRSEFSKSLIEFFMQKAGCRVDAGILECTKFKRDGRVIRGYRLVKS